MTGNTNMYHSYLLRIWRENASGEWRASLSNVLTGESRHFPNINALLAHICHQVEQPFPAHGSIDAVGGKPGDRGGRAPSDLMLEEGSFE